MTEPIICAMIFRMPRRASDCAKDRSTILPGAPFFTTVAPDVDKLVRTTLDAITMTAKIWNDDAQVSIAPPARVYCPLGVPPGATIWIDVVEHWISVMREFVAEVERLEVETDWQRGTPARAPRRKRS